jgi:hypothetical protein
MSALPPEADDGSPRSRLTDSHSLIGVVCFPYGH